MKTRINSVGSSFVTRSGLIIIRHARAEDVISIRAVGYELSLLSGASREASQDYLDCVFDRLWDVDYLSRIILDGGASVVVAESGSRVVGLAVAIPKPFNPSTAGLSRLCTRPAFRCASVRKRLLWACEDGLPQFVREVETLVPQDASEQIRFFKNAGYVSQGTVEMGNRAVSNTFVTMSKPR